MGTAGVGTLNIAAGGVVEGDRGFIGLYPGLTGEATVTGAGSKWDSLESLYVGGSSSRSGGHGTLNLYDSGLVTVADTIKLWSTGTINLNGGTLDTDTLDLMEGTFEMLSGQLHASNVLGDLDNQGGVVAPGNSAGMMTIFGDYVQHADATLEIELGGTIRGNEYDVLVVDGNLTLDGNLDVLAIGGFEPQAGDIFDILDFVPANLSGAFSAVNLPTLASELTWDNPDLLTDGQLRVLKLLLGDINKDEIVDVADLGILGAYFKMQGTSIDQADLNDDGIVDVADLGNLGANWSASQTTGNASALVPEPTTLSLLAVSVLMVGRRWS